jgi:hypothetical protein
MDVIIMQSTTSVLKKLITSHPQFTFIEGDNFLWSSFDNTIYYDRSAKDKSVYLLHEISHALLGHSNYDRDIELVSMERQAWDYTLKLAPKYNLVVPESIIQSTLDSYRNWMHERSTCPECESSGLQINKNSYMCPCCNHAWRVNEAKNCALRRYSL